MSEVDKQKLLLENLMLKSQLNKPNFMQDISSISNNTSPFGLASNYQNPENLMQNINNDPHLQKAVQFLKSRPEYLSNSPAQQNAQVTSVKIEAPLDSSEDILMKKIKLA